MILRSTPNVRPGVDDQVRLADAVFRLTMQTGDLIQVEIRPADDEENGMEFRRGPIVETGADADDACAGILVVDGGPTGHSRTAGETREVRPARVNVEPAAEIEQYGVEVCQVGRHGPVLRLLQAGH